MNQVLLTKTGKPRRRSRLREIWYGMRKRCFNNRYKEFHLYGGKGVTICDEWSSFANFESWALNNGYADNLSIDRIDSNGNYEPRNCRWATPREQTLNRYKTFWITINGEKKCLSDWCIHYKIDWHLVSQRIRNFKWEPLRALTTPSRGINIDVTGQRFGRLLVLERLPNNKYGGRFLCKCDCGNTKIVALGSLHSGTKSCGCLHSEQVSKANYKRYHAL